MISLRSYFQIPQTQNDPGDPAANFYNQTNYGYDGMGRQDKVTSGGGTITKSIFDARGLTTETWIGTDDSSGSSNMVKVSSQEYDDGNAGGNANLTRITQHASDTEDRVTQFEYDWRDRQTVTDGEENTYQSVTYNNQGLALVTESRSGNSSATLLSKSESIYDILGRSYRSKAFAVDALGNEGNILTSNSYFDPVGRLIKQSSPGTKAWIKTVYDSLGRSTATFSSYPADGSNDGNTNEVTDDIVMEQNETAYDDASNSIGSLQYQRFHNAPASGTGSKGALVPPPPSTQSPPYSEPYSRVYHGYQWPDAIGRPQASANYGTNDDARPDLIATADASSSALVSRTAYNNDGEVETSTDPQGIVFKREYDDVGRLTVGIENYLLGSSAADANNTKSYSYNSDGALKTLTWINAATGGSQVTTWDYGTTTPSSGVATSHLLSKKIYPDGGGDHVDYTYNQLGELVTKTDQNASVHTYEYNSLGKMTHDRVTTLGPTVDDAVLRISNEYDSHQRIETVTSWDEDATNAGDIVNQVKYAYNSFGQKIADMQEHTKAVVVGSKQVSYAYDTGTENTIRLNKITYPSDHKVGLSYNTSSMDDVLSRVASIQDVSASPPVSYADYQYLGYGTPVIAEYPEPGVSLTYLAQDTDSQLYGDPYNGIDWFGRIADQRWIKGGNNLDRIQYGYTENSLKKWRGNLVADALGKKEDEFYQYDDLSQVKERERGVLTPGKVISNVTETENWTYDPSGNWTGYSHDDDSIDVSQTQTHSKVNEIATYNGVTTPREYDNAGNMTRIPLGVETTSDYREASWDAWNRLRRIKKTGSGSTSGTTLDVWYDYDGLTRRTQKRIVTGANQGTVSYYYNSAWKCVEEYEGGSEPSKRYVYGVRGRNDLILRERDTNSDDTLNERLYALSDAMGSVTTITDAVGVEKQRYRYQAFGESQILNPNFTDWTSGIDYNWQTRFHGESRDAETGYYNYGYRYYLPELGRWPSRDPIGERGGVNIYAMVGNNVISRVDFLGLTEPSLLDFNNDYSISNLISGSEAAPNHPDPNKIDRVSLPRDDSVNCSACHPGPDERPKAPTLKTCCDDVKFDTDLYCCRDDKYLVSKAPVDTGIAKALRIGSDCALVHTGLVVPPHRTIDVGGHPYPIDMGGYPIGIVSNPVGTGHWDTCDPGLPTNADGTAEHTSAIFLSPCEYDIEKFNRCMRDRIVNELMPGKEVFFSIIGRNCRFHTDAVINSCKEKSKL